MKAGDIRYVSLGNSYTGESNLHLCVDSIESNHHKRSICFRNTALKARIVFSSA